MTETMPHPVDLALRAAATTLEPSRADFDYSRAKLTEAIATAIPHQRTRSRRSWAIGLALFVVVAVLLVQTVATSPAAAVITEIARVAEVSDPLVIPDDRFAYLRIDSTVLVEVGADSLPGIEIEHDSLFYLLPHTQERWTGDQGTVRLQETNHEPQFFSTADEQAYYAAGLDEGDRPGETDVMTQVDSNPILDEDWPADPGELEAKIRTQVGDDDIGILDQCLGLLREPLIPSELRAAVLRVIGNLDLELVDESPDGAGTFSLTFVREGPMRLTFGVDALGYLTFEELILIDGYPDQGVPPGTVGSSITYSAPVLVDSLP